MSPNLNLFLAPPLVRASSSTTSPPRNRRPKELRTRRTKSAPEARLLKGPAPPSRPSLISFASLTSVLHLHSSRSHSSNSPTIAPSSPPLADVIEYASSSSEEDDLPPPKGGKWKGKEREREREREQHDDGAPPLHLLPNSNAHARALKVPSTLWEVDELNCHDLKSAIAEPDDLSSRPSSTRSRARPRALPPGMRMVSLMEETYNQGRPVSVNLDDSSALTTEVLEDGDSVIPRTAKGQVIVTCVIS
ncbi:hypothetical protein T439DRAFT_328158 [Meredithblackwellia eburnea MCA 4105]